MATSIFKAGNDSWEVNKKIVTIDNYREFLHGQELANFENFVSKILRGRKIYQSIYSDEKANRTET